MNEGMNVSGAGTYQGVERRVEPAPGEQPRYPHNALEGYANGCLLDFRVRVAIELLTHSPIFGQFVGLVREHEPAIETAAIARAALDIASDVLRLGAERGLVDPLPSDDGDVSPELRAQAKRTASYQALQQKEAQAFLQREADQVVPQAASQIFPRGGRH